MGVLGITQSNSSMASALATYENLGGSWRGVYQELEDISLLNPYKVKLEAAKYLQPSNSFLGLVNRG